MRSNFAIAALIGSAKAATRGPLPVSTTFPKFSSVTSPSSGNLDGLNVKVDYSTLNGNIVGPYKGFRNNLFMFPT